MIGFATFLTLAAAPAVLEPQKIFSVKQAVEIVESGAAQGEVIRVRGYVSGDCSGRSCALHDRKWNQWDGPTLSLDGQTPIEKQIVANRGRRILLTARVGEASVRTDGDALIVCADRCSELIPIRIEN